MSTSSANWLCPTSSPKTGASRTWGLGDGLGRRSGAGSHSGQWGAAGDAFFLLMRDHLELSNVTKSYPTPNGPSVVVLNFNLRIRKGEFVTLIGHSGCGKSTVLSMIAGLSSITGGGIVLAGKEL